MALRRIRVLVAAAAIAAPSTAAGPARLVPAAGGPTFVLDVGSPADADPSAPIFLDEMARLSARQAEASRTWRTLDEGGLLYFHVRPQGIELAPDGVPYRDAIVDVTFADTVDEANCATVQSTRSYCRPNLRVRLDYGEDPILTWQPVGGLGGLNTGEWTRTSIFLESTPWQTLRAIDGRFELYIAYPDQLGDWRPLPIDEIRLRFVDHATLETEREADRAARGLERAEHVEDRALDPSLADRPYVVYGRPYVAMVYPNTVPSPEWVTDTLHTFEIAGESEPVTFAMYATRDVHAVTVRASDLVSPVGRIAADRVRLNLVGVSDKRWGYGYDRLYGRHPWFLDDLAPFDVPAGTSRQVWATLDVPPDAPAGEYAGSILVSPEDAAASTIAVRLRVVALDLAPPDATPYLYHSPYLRGKQFAPRRITALRDMAAHDINPIVYLDAEIDLHEFTADARDLPTELSELRDLGILPPEPRVGIADNVDALWRLLCPSVPVFAAACGDFDAAYVHVLEQYEEEFAAFGVVPVLSFTDEPGNDPERRIRSNYLDRLTRAAGMRTWVTYYPRCEEALAGHRLTFADLVTDAEPTTPDWLRRNDHLRAYWDFTDGPSDLSPHANDGSLGGGARVEAGALVLPDDAAYMRVADDDALDLAGPATVSLWLRPTACTSGYAWHPLSKWSGTAGANYVLYLFGDYDGAYPESLGTLRMFADAGGSWSAVSGTGRVDCAAGLDRWYHVVWTYDPASGGTLLVNGVPFPASRTGPLATNDAPLDVGRFPGAVDEVALLDRALTADEQLDLATAANASYDRGQEVRLVLDLPAGADVPTTITFSIDDAQPAPESLETVKALEVAGRTAWSARGIALRHQLVTVDLAPYLSPTGPNRLVFRVTNGDARQEDVRLYLVDDAWRNAPWALETSSHWRGEYRPDDSGALGPMDPYLDDRVYALSYVSGGEIDRTRAAGDTFSYYSTYPATQPVIVNNRFLNGIYASAVGATGVYVYAYGDWGAQPWDDTEPSYVERIGNATARRSQNNYELVMPSWDDRVYDTLVYESLREGIEDSRVIATLKRAIAAHPGPRADAAQAWLDDLLGRVTRDYAPRYMSYASGGPIDGYADRSGEMLADLAGDAEAFGFFDETRRRMVDLVLELESEAAGRLTIHLPYAAVGGARR